jgi:peptide/nickel transport system substrate-binding protein
MKYVSLKSNVLLTYGLILFLFPLILHKPSLAHFQRYHDIPDGDTLIIGEFIKPSPINPILTHSTISAVLKDIVFDGLAKINERIEPTPHLALSWKSSEDGLAWTFYLRKNVHFHDGVELTAEDVKFTFDKIYDPSINSPYISIFKDFKLVKVKNKHTIEIRLKSPLPSLPFYLDVGILPRHLLKGKDVKKSPFNYHPIGTGPFKMQKWSSSEIILEANRNYFGQSPHLDRIIVKFFKNQEIIWAKLMKGEIDCVYHTLAKNLKIIENIPDIRVYSFLNLYYHILAFNNNNTYFTDRSVRQALNYAVDKKAMLKRVLYGKGIVSSGTVYPFSRVFDEKITPYSYNPKMAQELLSKAGWKDTNGNSTLDKNGREFEFVLLIVEGDDVSRESALLIQQQLLDIGIRMKVKPISFPVMYKEFLSRKEFDASFLRIVSDDPDKNYAWWHSSQIDHGFNVFSYRNKRIDELLDKGRTTLDKRERKRIYHQFQREIYEDPPGIFLFWRDYLITIHKRFKGVKLSPAGILNHVNEWHVPKDEQKYK